MPAGRGNTLNVLVYFLSRSKLCHLSLSTASKQCTANGTVMSGNSAFFINEIKQMLNKLDGKKKLLICVSRNDQISKVKVILEYFLVYFVARSRLTHRRLVVFFRQATRWNRSAWKSAQRNRIDQQMLVQEETLFFNWWYFVFVEDHSPPRERSSKWCRSRWTNSVLGRIAFFEDEMLSSLAMRWQNVFVSSSAPSFGFLSKNFSRQGNYLLEKRKSAHLPTATRMINLRSMWNFQVNSKIQDSFP